MKVKCPICEGMKYLNGMGGMRQDCPFCKSTGWIIQKPKKKKVKAKIDINLDKEASGA